MTADQAREYLRFYRDLGFEELYVRHPPASTAPPATAPPSTESRPSGSGSLFSPAGPSGETLEQIRADLGDCTRCRLHKNSMPLSNQNTHIFRR